MNRKYRKILRPENILLDLKAGDKQGVILELVDHLVRTGTIPADQRDAVVEAVLAREKRMSTGLQHGVAVPHGKTDAVRELVAALGRSRLGVDFGCMDGQPAHIFILILSPESMAGPHVEFLAEISRLLTQAGVRDKIMSAASAEDVMRIFDEYAGRE